MNKIIIKQTIFLFTIMISLSACIPTRVIHDFWWNHYQQGVLFADQGMWKKAENFFLKALKDRYDDKILAKKYQRHFINYFPHRELGCVYFHLQQYEKAINELETSLTFEKTAKAKIYLNRARLKLVQQKQLDRQIPDIQIFSPENNYTTSKPFIIIRGKVTDDTFIKKIKIGNQPLSMVLSEKCVDFNTRVQVSSGKNSIIVCATDITNKTNKASVTIYVDHLSPVTSLDRTVITHSENKKYATISLHAFDNIGISEIIINNKQYVIPDKKELFFKKRIAVSNNQKKIALSVKDTAGNIIKDNIELQKTFKQATLLAGLTIDTSMYFSTSNWSDQKAKKIETTNIVHKRLMEDRHPTKISFFNQIPNVIFTDGIYIQGAVSDKDGIKKLYFNEENVTINQRAINKFSFYKPLIKGKNSIIIRVIDSYDNEHREEHIINKKMPSVHLYETRASVFISDFKHITLYNFEKDPFILFFDGNKQSWHDVFQYHLQKTITKTRRFRTTEKNNSESVDYYIWGDIVRRMHEIHIYLRLNDKISLSQYISEVNVFHEIDPKESNIYQAINDMAKIAAELLYQKHPILKGKILEVNKPNIVIDLGKETMIKSGVKLILYDKSIDYDFKQSGEAKVINADMNRSYAKLIKTMSDITKNHYVITK